jgi:carbon storage regulator CsrA
MLVLSRRIGEQILVPSCDITLTVLSIKGARGQLGISAPRSDAVDRGEIVRETRAHAERPCQQDE